MRQPSAKLSEAIQRHIDDLPVADPAAWPLKVCREEYNALPLCGNNVYLWALRPDGAVLCLDHEAFRLPCESETDPGVIFAVLSQGARTYPELQELVPSRPNGVRPCDSCEGSGSVAGDDGLTGSCLGCSGLGWILPDLQTAPTPPGDGESSVPDPRTAEILALLETALYDTGGESVEGAFVDRYESYAGRAVDELDDLFEATGFSEADEALLHEAATHPLSLTGAPVGLLTGLKRWSPRVIARLLASGDPDLRAIGVRASPCLPDSDAPTRFLTDPDPRVRVAALEIPGGQHQQPGVPQRAISVLDDPSALVRRAAVTNIAFFGRPEGGAALLRRLAIELDRMVRKTILLHLASSIRSAGISASAARVEELIGPDVKATMLRELHHDDPEVRAAIASAMERLRGEDVATAMLDRLLIESDRGVRCQILLFNGFAHIKERALAVLSRLLIQDADGTIRTRAGFLLEFFGPEATAPLLAALDDPSDAVRRAAVMSLGKAGDARALPALREELARPESQSFDRELVSAIRDVILRNGLEDE